MSEKNDGDIDKLTGRRSPFSKRDDQIAKLQSDLNGERRNRKIEQFAFFLVAVIAFDAACLRGESVGLYTIVGIFEIVLTIIVGRQLGVTDVKFLLEDAVQLFRAKPSESEAPKVTLEATAANTPSTASTPGHSAPPP